MNNPNYVEFLRDYENYLDIYTLKAEYIGGKRDKHNRHSYKNYERDSFIRPHLSEFLVSNDLIGHKYPHGHEFAICLSHDVDNFMPPLHHTILSSLICLKQFDKEKFKKQLFWKRGDLKESPYNNFELISSIEKKYGAESTFFVMATKKDIHRVRYNPKSIIIAEELNKLVDDGFEVGLHGGYYSYNNVEDISNEKKIIEEIIGKNILGYRGHYLRFIVPETWRLLSKLGFKYDATLGFADKIGFRNRMCHPFIPYDLKNNEYIDILEIPMAVMDGPLFSNYSDPKILWERIKEIIEHTKRLGGVLNINWHSESFNCPFRHNWEKLYDKILSYCSQSNAWMTTGENIWRNAK